VYLGEDRGVIKDSSPRIVAAQFNILHKYENSDGMGLGVCEADRN